MVMHDHATQGMVTSHLFNLWLSNFVECVQAQGGRIFEENRFLLILDGHNSHVTVDVV